MDADERYQALQAKFDRSDRYLLSLAAIAVAIYMVDLLGAWRTLGVQRAYEITALLIDSVFVVDLLLKVYYLRGRYTKSVWAMIDFLSALPILASLSATPSFFEGLRIARGIRLFRMLRMLRTLRVLRSIRLFQFVKPPPETSPERKRFERTLFISVLIYTGLFLSLMTIVTLSQPRGDLVGIHGPADDGTFRVEMQLENTVDTLKVTPERLLRSSDELEFYFVLGSVLGMLLIVVVARAQVPAIASHQVRTLLNVALPPQVAEHFMKSPEHYDKTVSAPATIVFCDIRGFTSAVEALGDDLEALKFNLEAAMDVVVEIHMAYDLIVDKFIGDAVMSFRGGDLFEGTPAEHAWRVVKASIDVPRALTALDNPYFRHIRVGGASAEDALIGTFGTSSRLSYTVLGDRVNLASRLESASNPLGTSNLFCDRTRALTADRDDIVWRKVGGLKAQGKKEVVVVHEAFNADDSLDWLEQYEAGLTAYESADFATARSAFAEVDEARPEGDGPSKYYLKNCERLLAKGAPKNWKPVLALKK